MNGASIAPFVAKAVVQTLAERPQTGSQLQIITVPCRSRFDIAYQHVDTLLEGSLRRPGLQRLLHEVVDLTLVG